MLPLNLKNEKILYPTGKFIYSYKRSIALPISITVKNRLLVKSIYSTQI